MNSILHLRRTFSRAFRRFPIIASVVFACALASPAVAADAIDINTATAEEFAAAMSGVGFRKAEAIVADREMNGPFTSIDDLVRVRGIGDRTVEANRERLSVAQPSAAPPMSTPPMSAAGGEAERNPG